MASEANMADRRPSDGDTAEDQAPADFLPSYQDEGRTVLGCAHYQRSCKIFATCCNQFFTCHWCHDEQSADSHVMDRKESKQVVCMICKNVQPMSSACHNEKCSAKDGFAKYFCASCLLFESNPSRHIYHCDKCGICRVGRGLDIDYFHCDKCSACISTEHRDHKCVEGNTKNNCPICFEFMFTSRNPVVIAKCGHAMHEACFKMYTSNNMYTCPVCFKSLGSMGPYFADLDRRLANEPVLPGHQNLRNRITCNDCELRCLARYHPHYHKCSNCGSYNTSVLDSVVLGPEELAAQGALQGVAPVAPAAAAAAGEGVLIAPGHPGAGGLRGLLHNAARAMPRTFLDARTVVAGVAVAVFAAVLVHHNGNVAAHDLPLFSRLRT